MFISFSRVNIIRIFLNVCCMGERVKTKIICRSFVFIWQSFAFNTCFYVKFVFSTYHKKCKHLVLLKYKFTSVGNICCIVNWLFNLYPAYFFKENNFTVYLQVVGTNCNQFWGHSDEILMLASQQNRTWSGCIDAQAGPTLYWCQKLNNFGSSRVRVNTRNELHKVILLFFFLILMSCTYLLNLHLWHLKHWCLIYLINKK